MVDTGWIVNEVPKWIILFIWYGLNVYLWVTTFLTYHTGPQYYYTKHLTGPAVSVAKACGLCLNFNCMLILLPVCRNLISYVRGSCTCCKKSVHVVRRQLDKNIAFHKAVAYMICFHSALHVGAHFFNFDGYLDAHSSEEGSLAFRLTKLPTQPNGTWVNPIRSVNQALPFGLPLIEETMVTIAGVSGVVITVALVVMVTSATETIRRSYFEVFWFTHHLFVIFFAGLVVHGLGGIVRGQINVDEHDPDNCLDKPWGPNEECREPQFAGSPARSWVWVTGPIFLYLVERGIRLYRSFQTVNIVKVVKHPSKVMEIRMKRNGFSMLPGQYIFLQCPKVSSLEWHPFTLTSMPEDDYFSVHIRLVGDWTTALAKNCGFDESEFQDPDKLPSLGVDGPFGTSSTDIFRYSVGVCVAAGIGATPFASVLKSIWYKHCHDDVELKLKKIYFYWICPDTKSFEWFTELLIRLDQEMIEQGKANFLDYNIFLTRGWDANQARNIYLHEGDEEDVVTGLKQKTHYGRPNWDDLFPSIAESNAGQNIGVFFCGPKALSSVLHKKCNEYSTLSSGGAQFHYNKENF
ncbi:cytochrome b-245 heavy chain-like [Ptychodera flava]|uniref:cytochrome b-245 heavy chain-like n=1 Tax=Ptychodera flava TaxID=63121 RepID=UPI00396A9D8C